MFTPCFTKMYHSCTNIMSDTWKHCSILSRLKWDINQTTTWVQEAVYVAYGAFWTLQKNFSDILECASWFFRFVKSEIELQNEPFHTIWEADWHTSRLGCLFFIKRQSGRWLLNERKNDVFGDNRNHTTFYTYNYGDTLQISLLIVSGPTLRLKSINSNYTLSFSAFNVRNRVEPRPINS